jgi:type III secretion protein J
MRLKKSIKIFCFSLALIFLTGCETSMPIVNNVDEREANEIIVYLAKNNVKAQKIPSTSGEIGGMGATNKWNITVFDNDSVKAMALLNEVGLPRRSGTNLLELFAKSGLMSSDREETIRYHAGLAEELKNTIRKMDGVLDADVQVSFPFGEPLPGEEPPKITAAIYVKHQGVLDNPNNNLESKIKRLVSGSIPSLEYNNVSVISDRSRFMSWADVSTDAKAKEMEKDYVKLWSVTMSRQSVAKFRAIFFFMLFTIFVLSGLLVWLAYHFYPQIFQRILNLKRVISPKKK